MTQIKKLAFTSICAFIAVIAIIGILLGFAQINEQPLYPIEIAKNKLLLKPSSAIPYYNPNMFPKNLELKKQNFSYTHGCELDKERKNRYLSNWEANKVLNWTLNKRNFNLKKISIKYRSKNKTVFQGRLFNQPFKIEAPKAEQWNVVELDIQADHSTQNTIEVFHQSESVDLMLVSLES